MTASNCTAIRTLALLGLAAVLPVRAQDSLSPGATPTIKVNSNLVAVSAVVRDKSGQPIPNLATDAFVLKQDGKPQPITYFS